MSPSVAETIRKQKEEKARKEAEIAYMVQQQKLKNEREQQERDYYAQKKQEQRLAFVKAKTEQVLKTSGTFTALEEVNTMLLSDVKKHDLVKQYDVGKILVVWGNKYTITHKSNNNDAIGYEPEKGFLGFKTGVGLQDYSYISVSVDPDTENITIEGSSSRYLSSKEWKTNTSLITEAIANSFQSPGHKTDDDRPPSYSSSSSSNTECCNS